MSLPLYCHRISSLFQNFNNHQNLSARTASQDVTFLLISFSPPTQLLPDIKSQKSSCFLSNPHSQSKR